MNLLSYCLQGPTSKAREKSLGMVGNNTEERTRLEALPSMTSVNSDTYEYVKQNTWSGGKQLNLHKPLWSAGTYS